MMQGDTHAWCFARHTPDDAILLKPPSGSDERTAVSFDAAVVKAVWTIAHKRAATQESFLIVMKQP